MKVQIIDSFEPITESILAAFEEELGIKLPNDYRQFLMMYHGGTPNPNIFDVHKDGFTEHIPIVRFLGIKRDDSYSFLNFLEIYEDRLPANLLPIADDHTGGLECLSIHGEDYGKVYFWDSDFENTEKEPDYSNVYLLAENFTDFLNKLYDPDKRD